MERLSAQVAGLNEALETEQAARTVAAREAKEKGDKLDRLESEQGLGWAEYSREASAAVAGRWKGHQSRSSSSSRCRKRD